MSRNIKSRLEKVEATRGAADLAPLIVWADQAPPANPAGRHVIRIGWMTSEEAAGRVW